MLDIKRIRERPDEVREGLKRRWMDTALVDNVLELDAKRRALVTETDALKAKRNEVSKSIGERVKAGEDVEAVKAEMRAVGDAIAAKDVEIRATEEAFREAMLRIPNVPNKDIATGPDSSANRDVRHVGTMPTFDFQPLDHIALGEKLGIFDFPRGVKLTGTGFPILLGPGARLQRALIQYMLDLHTRFQGYTEMLPPFVVNTASMIGTGQLPKMKDDMYHCEVDDFWLIPTAEVPVTNYYRDDVLEAAQLPVKLTAYTPCFRREAGSAGKDTRGILRVHQFDKVATPPPPTTSSRSSSRTPRTSSPAWASTSACSSSAPATSPSLPPSATTWSSGPPASRPGSRSPAAPTSRASRPAAPTSATAAPTASSTSCTPSTAPAWPSPA